MFPQCIISLYYVPTEHNLADLVAKLCEDLVKLGYDISFKFPRFYSETKFANYVKLVYRSFQVDYPAIVRTFQELVSNLNKGTSEDRKKAKDISAILGKIYTMKFSLLLSGSCDIYDRFGIGVNLLQKVSILPHTKFDKFVSTVVKGFAQMGDTVDSQNCPCSTTPGSEDCLWPQLHKDLLEIRTRLSYHDVPVGQLVAVELSTRAGVKRTKENQLLDQAGIVSRCLERLKVYAEHLGNKLFEKVRLIRR